MDTRYRACISAAHAKVNRIMLCALLFKVQMQSCDQIQLLFNSNDEPIAFVVLHA
jgi:hypothetical protein